MNLARIKLYGAKAAPHHSVWCRLSAFHKLADAMLRLSTRTPTSDWLKDSLPKHVPDLDIIARMIFSLLPKVKTGVVLSAWIAPTGSSGSSISIFPMLGITYAGLPSLWYSVSKRGNSNWRNARRAMERFYPSFRVECIDCLVADREFIGKEWTGWLNSRRIRYYIRIRQNFWIVKPSTGERIRAWWLLYFRACLNYL